MTDEEIIAQEYTKPLFVNPVLRLLAYISGGKLVELTDMWGRIYHSIACAKPGYYYKSWIYFITRVGPIILYSDGSVKKIEGSTLISSYVKKWKFL